jgi:multimeric flavodoxin WrbA
MVWISTTGGTRLLAVAAAAGAARHADALCRLVPAQEAELADLILSDAYLFATAETLASISGLMKDFFERCYYPALGRIDGRPYAAMICAGSDGQNAARQIARIATGWRLREVAAPLIVSTRAQTPAAIQAPKTIAAADLARCEELGETLAAGLAGGII